MNIQKWFDTERQAENYYQSLLDMYNYVRLTGFPRWSQSGYYQFFVLK